MFLPLPRPQDGRHCSVAYVLGIVVPFILIISSLAAFTILSVHHLYLPNDLQRNAPHVINTSTLAIRQVACVLPRSGQYLYQRYIYYGLLIATTIITIVLKEKHALWLASGAAATALLYSGVAAVHQILIFGFGLGTQRYSTCAAFPLPSTNYILPICHDLDDQDRDTACMIVGAALLAILPIAMWSMVFKKAAARPILVLWMLLMASSHVFCAVSKTETTVHYQICPADQVEDLPGLAFQATELTDVFRTTYSDTASNTNSSFATRNEKCLYSCFSPHRYALRAGRDLAVLDNTKPVLNQIPSLSSRRLGVAFWAIYLVCSILALLEQLQASETFRDLGYWRPFYPIIGPLHRAYPWLKKPVNTRTRWREFRKIHSRGLICVRLLVHVVFHFPRFLSAIMFIGYIVSLEWTHWDAPESEPFTAVGQFGAVAVVLLVAVGTLFSRLAEPPGKVDDSSSPEGEIELRDGTAAESHVRVEEYDH
jgi:hypothetical protein